MDAFFYVANKDPMELVAYEDMLPRMVNIEDRLKRITDEVIKQEVLKEYKLFLRKSKRCDRLIALRKQLEKTKSIRDAYQVELAGAQQERNESRRREEEASNKVSQDHMRANESHRTLHELFPNRSNYGVNFHERRYQIKHTIRSILTKLTNKVYAR